MVTSLEKSLFKKTLEMRLANRLTITTFDELTKGGSKLRFEVAMAIDGYPFELPIDVFKGDYSPLISSEQLMSGEYDESIEEVFAQALSKSKYSK